MSDLTPPPGRPEDEPQGTSGAPDESLTPAETPGATPEQPSGAAAEPPPPQEAAPPPPPPPPPPPGPTPGAPAGAPAGIPAQPFPTPAGSATDMTPWGERAQWPVRVQGALVDFVGPGLVAAFFSAFVDFFGFVIGLIAFGWALYNAYLNGQTGQSYGKQWAGTKLVREQDGQLIGGGMGIARYFLHILDALPCYIGFLWPIWDDKRQTFADKILTTTVVKV